MSQPRILLYDLETSPALGFTWGRYDQNVLKFVRQNTIMSVAWKWFGEKTTTVKQVCDFKGYKPKPLYANLDNIKGSAYDDLELCKYLFNLIDEADVVMGHNSRRFDDKITQARFLVHDLGKPSPYMSIDTLLTLRRNFKMTNYFKLDDICAELGIGNKVKHEGFGLWIKCLDGDLKAWERMRKYAKKDVQLLEQLFIKLRPWVEKLNLGVYQDNSVMRCSVCGSKKLNRRGFSYTNTYKYQRYQCGNCGKWNKSRTCEPKQSPQLKGEV